MASITIPVEMEYDGTYWVARCEALGLVAATSEQRDTWHRIFNMVGAQLCFALNQSIAPDKVFTPAFSDLADTVAECKRRKHDIRVTIEDRARGLSADDIMPAQACR